MTTRVRLIGVLAALGILSVLVWRSQRPASAPVAGGGPGTQPTAVAGAGERPATSASQADDAVASTGALWRLVAPVEGVPLDPQSAVYRVRRLRGDRPLGRSAAAAPLTQDALNALAVGAHVRLPLLDGTAADGRVNHLVRNENGWTRVGGVLTGTPSGTFAVAASAKESAALLLLPERSLALEIERQRDGRLLLLEKALESVICTEFPRVERAASPRVDAPVAAALLVPVLASRPGAQGVLYIDFDGETVTEAVWNGGLPIVAAPSTLSEDGIREVWARVSEDYRPFDVNVTTDLASYHATPPGLRARVIVTPTDTASPGAGGVAYLFSFSRAGQGVYSPTIPAWVFNSGIKSIAEAVAHEAGHTFGLQHDGLTSPVDDYYDGHGSGAVGWAPIMGSGYTRSLTQWSRGEYANANQTEDDVAIIAGPTNRVGYAADEAGGTPASAAPLDGVLGNIDQGGGDRERGGYGLLRAERVDRENCPGGETRLRFAESGRVA